MTGWRLIVGSCALALGLVVTVVLLGGSAPTRSASTQSRVLLITGGKSYDREPFLQVFRDDPGLVITHLEHSGKAADAWDRADLDACDVVLLYDMPRDITDAQKARFLALFTRGIGLVVTHHALVSFQRWPEYERIVGGRYFDLPEKGGDPRETPSGYQHDVDMPIQVAHPHPVTAAVEDFTIHDEIYWGFRVSKDVTTLLTTSHPKSGNPIGWARTQGKSKVVYLQLGHGASAYTNPNYRRLLGNAIRYVAKR